MDAAEAFSKLDEAVFSLFGKPVIYTPAGGEAKEILAVIHFGPLPGEASSITATKYAQENLARIVIRADAVLGIPSPARRDEVAITAPSGAQETWLVDKAPEGDGAIWRLDLIRDRRPIPGR
jgi:hypothetical protein